MNDAWLEDTTDVLHCSMPPQVRAHIEELRDEVARLRAAEVPLSANVGFALVRRDYSNDDHTGEVVTVWGEGQADEVFATEADVRDAAALRRSTPVALIPLTAWDRT